MAERGVTFRKTGDVLAVYVGDQRVARIPDDAEREINVLVDVLEALGIHPLNANSGPMPIAGSRASEVDR